MEGKWVGKTCFIGYFQSRHDKELACNAMPSFYRWGNWNSILDNTHSHTVGMWLNTEMNSNHLTLSIDCNLPASLLKMKTVSLVWNISPCKNLGSREKSVLNNNSLIIHIVMRHLIYGRYCLGNVKTDKQRNKIHSLTTVFWASSPRIHPRRC